MGKDKERKSYQPSSSAKAAEQLASGGPKAAGFTFGGWASSHGVISLQGLILDAALSGYAKV